jgi:peptide/nickel transport system ATP-binding protein
VTGQAPAAAAAPADAPAALPLNVEHLDVAVRGGRKGRDVQILCDVSLTASPGEIVAVVGESGCGKSTLAAAIAGLLLPATTRLEGRILLDGAETTGLAEKDLRRFRGRVVGFVPQDHIGAFNPVLTVERHLTEAPLEHLGISRRQARQLAVDLLRMVRLDATERILGCYPHQLSGGMRQRVMIAAAMSCGPRLLVADEPTTALDVTVQAEILSLLRELCRSRGTAMILVSHDLSVVAGIADRVAVLYSGEVVEEGPAPLILRSPRHPYTEALLRSVPDPDDRGMRSRPLDTIPGRPPDIGSRPEGCWFHPRCPYGADGDDCARTHPPLVAEGGRSVRTFHPRPGAAAAAGEAAAARQVAVPPTGRSAPVLLEVSGLTKAYPTRSGLVARGARTAGHVALRDVSVQIGEGQTFGLVGESGSGKSTLAHCVLQLARPYSGTIAFDGRPLDQLAGEQMRRARRHFQVIFQDARNSLDPRLTIGAAVAEALNIHGDRARNADGRVLEVLGQVGLGAAIAQRYPRQCSGGELQRVCIARALILRPKLLICDEAVSSLDVSTRAQVLNLLRDLQASEGIAILFISHDFGAVAAMSDVVGVLDHGRLVECAEAEKVLRRPEHDYTRRLLDAVPRLAPAPMNSRR